MYYRHEPVMADMVSDYLVSCPEGTYIDATLGSGGHSAYILERLSSRGCLWGIDQDIEAIGYARNKLDKHSNFIAVLGNFGDLLTLVPYEFHGCVDGIFADLGVSTHHILMTDRGFSYDRDGKLDMRMTQFSDITAEYVINNYSEKELGVILIVYAEERYWRKLSKAIVKNRPIYNTFELKEIIFSSLGKKQGSVSLARIFQGIRMEVNQEIDMLKRFLLQSIQVLKKGGRIIVISYNSLEDRIVKRMFKTGNPDGIVDRDQKGNIRYVFNSLFKGVKTPSDIEIQHNPKARSAKMRVAELI